MQRVVHLQFAFRASFAAQAAVEVIFVFILFFNSVKKKKLEIN